MPAQSGSSSVLSRMRRGYSRESYLDLIQRTRALIPEIAFSTDIIAGFCGETEEEHKDSVALMKLVQYDQAFMFAYSQREKTHAHRVYKDDVPEEIKLKRLQDIIGTYQQGATKRNQRLIGTGNREATITLQLCRDVSYCAFSSNCLLCFVRFFSSFQFN